MKILLLEDDVYIQDLVSNELSKKGYEVEVASSSAEFWQKKCEKEYALYLLDILLPDDNGISVCRELRKISSSLIIFLTSCDDEESITKGLNSGADDYITKPFRMSELIARISANLRRLKMNNEISGNSQVFGDVTVDLDNMTIKKNGENLTFSDIEWQLIRILVGNAGLIVKREVLLEKVWDNKGNFVEDNTLTVAICRIKAKLGKEHIDTIRGIGYRWIQ